MYYLIGILKEVGNNKIVIETKNGIGYIGYFLKNEKIKDYLNKEAIFYVYEYKSEIDQYNIFFVNKKMRNCFESLIEIKSVGLKIIQNIFEIFSLEDFTKIIKENNFMLLSSVNKIGENLSRKIIESMKQKLYNKKYSKKLLNVISSVHKLGYTNQNIYKVIDSINIDLPEEQLLRKVIQELTVYE